MKVVAAEPSRNPIVLSTRALNRALLARQMLLDRQPIPALAAVEALAGLQAQIPGNPYVALWSRLVDFDPAELSGLLERREVVRANLMRATIHLVTTADYPTLRLLGAGAIWRDVFRNATYGGQRLEGLDMPAVLAAGREWLEAAPRSAADLRTFFAARWPDRDPAALAYATRALLPLVHVTPRGTWGRSGQTKFTTFETWTGASERLEPVALDPAGPTAQSTTRPGLERTILRYLQAFGPASVADAQAWSGATGLRATLERLRPRLLVFRDERGRELYDVPDGLRPDADTPTPSRFLPEYDNVLLGHADRSRVIGEGDRKRLFNPERIRGALLVDGFVAGAWRLVRASGRSRPAGAELELEPFGRLSPADHAAVEREAWALLGLLAPASEARSIRFVE